jgi:hypothetical protein
MIPAHDSASTILLRGAVTANQVPVRWSGMRRTAETNRAGPQKDFRYRRVARGNLTPTRSQNRT